MTPQQKLLVILVIFIINTAVALGYFLYGVYTTKQHEEQRLNKYLILSIVMFLCPVVVPLVYLFGALMYRIFFDSSIDLAAITFSKERVDVIEHPDVESEINLVPMEEAILIDDKENLRQLLLTVLRGDVSKSINAVTKALNSTDSEASHYAASAIMDITNEFQNTLQKFHAQLESNPNDKEVNQLFIEYLIKMLSTNFLSELELKTYVYMLSQLCQNAYDFDKEFMKVEYYSNLIHLLVQISDIQTADLWVTRLLEAYPNEMETFRCLLGYYYTIQDKDNFFEHMERLKKSDVTIDKDLLDLIRIYS